MIPGANILGMATRVISTDAVQYRRFISRTTNDAGFDVPNYAQPVIVRGSLQPVPREMYSEMGLDFEKNYWNFYMKREAKDISRDSSGDQFDFCGKTYQVESKTPWYKIDGWDQILCIEIPLENARVR